MLQPSPLATDGPVDPVKGNSMGKGDSELFLGWRAFARTSTIPSTGLVCTSPILVAGTLVCLVKGNSVGDRARGLFLC